MGEKIIAFSGLGDDWLANPVFVRSKTHTPYRER
jgi:hypothetical protein